MTAYCTRPLLIEPVEITCGLDRRSLALAAQPPMTAYCTRPLLIEPVEITCGLDRRSLALAAQPPMTASLRAAVEQTRHRAVLEHLADGAGDQRRDRQRRQLVELAL